ncbi:hypothetical protein JYB62_10170 [Algoriphagus lutimaris]|uniref:DUF6090 family protein n=1 Tax=Algoriphagus lutimaris TaxID=613197 RepID=UPI00196B607F|nr:DUF6090 family protein [Algoriphagus lutimaris]MBN3520369.1 hypothetical protein [Algoriphagus lutimaris]
MINFFRKIRYRLMEHQLIGKYMKYAVGEIILVVIGILIAFQLNEWNDHRKQVKLEQEYYCRLLDDVRLDEKQTQILLEQAEERLVASNHAVRLLLEDNSEKIEIASQITRSTKAVFSDFKPNNSAFDDLKSGANLNIISDKLIIKALNRYFNRFEELKSIIMVNGKHAVDILFAHEDYFANGAVQASIREGRFKDGLDEDLKEAILVLDDDILTSQMRRRLLNESLEFVSVNTRQIELYQLLLQETNALKVQLEVKCAAQ